MANSTKIQWTDFSANPIRARMRDGSNRVPGHYCEKISSGCANCYASRMQPRFGLPQFPGHGKRSDAVEVFLDDGELSKLLRSRKLAGKRVFVSDMTDAFGEWVPDEWLDKLFAVFALRPDVTFQVLTKRPERMAEYLSDPIERVHAIGKQAENFDGAWKRSEYFSAATGRSMVEIAFEFPLPNVWLGTSVENQATADERIPHLLRTPAAVRFLSVEPLLSEVDLRLAHVNNPDDSHGIDWVIVGSESFPGKRAGRACDLDWARSLVEQTRAAGVAMFVKQLPVNGKVSGDILEFPEDLRVREFPSTPTQPAEVE